MPSAVLHTLAPSFLMLKMKYDILISIGKVKCNYIINKRRQVWQENFI